MSDVFIDSLTPIEAVTRVLSNFFKPSSDARTTVGISVVLGIINLD